MTLPKLLHRVWVGPNEPPAEFDYTDDWHATNPDWNLLTWTDRNVALLGPLVCQELYDQSPTYVHRADIILYETVWKYGGIAVGYDMQPLRPLEPFIGSHDVFCTPDADGFPGQAFFGATPHHPAIGLVMQTLKTRISRDGWTPDWPQPHKDTGPYLWGETFGRHGEHAHERGMTILGDWKTAYPVRYWEKHLFDNPHEYARRTRNSVVVHRFAGSWVGPDADVMVRRPDAAGSSRP